MSPESSKSAGALPKGVAYGGAPSLPRGARAFASLDLRTVVVGLWMLAALFAAALWSIERVVLGRRADLLVFRQDLWLLALWALAAPAILWSARRYPTRGPAAVRNALLHFTAGTAFVVVTNVLIRLPLLLPPYAMDVELVVRDTLLALARFYPAALIVYGVIVALGHQVVRAARAPVREPYAPAEPSTQRPAAEPVPAATVASDGTVPGAVDGTSTEVEHAGGLPERVVVREWNRVHLVRPEDIDWVEADDNYVVVHAAGRTYKGRGRISELETQLDPACFVRVHRSAIVRVTRIREVQPLTKGDLALILHDGKVLRVARGRRAALEAALEVGLRVPL